VSRIQISVLLIAAIALPAATHSAFAPNDGACFTSGKTTYRIALNAASPDFRVRIASDTAAPDLRMRLVEQPEAADFVLVDDSNASKSSACRSASPVRTVKLDDDRPDVTVRLSAEGPTDYTLYVRSARFSQQHGAAFMAAIWQAERRHEMAARPVP
jgi:hypothetical protein